MHGTSRRANIAEGGALETAMQDMQAQLEKLRTGAEECAQSATAVRPAQSVSLGSAATPAPPAASSSVLVKELSASRAAAM
jgi:hypothetical protein